MFLIENPQVSEAAGESTPVFYSTRDTDCLFETFRGAGKIPPVFEDQADVRKGRGPALLVAYLLSNGERPSIESQSLLVVGLVERHGSPGIKRRGSNAGIDRDIFSAACQQTSRRGSPLP